MCRALAEVVSRRRLDAVPAVPEADLVQVGLEDLLLVIVLFHLARGGLLAKLAHRALVPPVDQVGVHVPDELLRDRARAAWVAAHGILQRAGYPHHVHAVVLVEALVLHCHEGLSQIAGERPDRNERALFLPSSPINDPSRANTSDDCGGTMIRHASLDSRSCAGRRTAADKAVATTTETRRNNRGPAIARNIHLTASNVPPTSSRCWSGHCDNDHASGIPMLA